MISMDLSEQFIQRISLAHQGFVLPFVNDGPSLTGNGRCVISAVVRYNKNVQKFLGIVLSPQAADQLTDHSAFVACGNDGRVFVIFLGLGRKRVLPPTGGERNKEIVQLIQIDDSQQDKDPLIEIIDKLQHDVLRLISTEFVKICRNLWFVMQNTKI